MIHYTRFKLMSEKGYPNRKASCACLKIWKTFVIKKLRYHVFLKSIEEIVKKKK